jgi:hypothetical protein
VIYRLARDNPLASLERFCDKRRVVTGKLARAARLHLTGADAPLVFLALLLGSSSLSYPFGDDQGVYYDYGASERVGLWLRSHSSMSDTVAVRGFQPEIYAIAQRRYAGRFLWTNFIVDDQRNMRKAEWRQEDLTALAQSNPRYVVTMAQGGDIDKPPFFEALGYRKRLEDGALAVYERP